MTSNVALGSFPFSSEGQHTVNSMEMLLREGTCLQVQVTTHYTNPSGFVSHNRVRKPLDLAVALSTISHLKWKKGCKQA